MTQCLSWGNRKKITVSFVLLLAVIFFILPQTTFAQGGLEYASSSGLGTMGLKPMIFSIINIMLGFLGIVAIIIILYGGFVWMTSAGDSSKIDKAKKIFGAVGRVMVLDEKYFDAVTGLSASGPAFIYVVIESLAEGGVKAGLPREIATELVAQTMLGSSKLVLETRRSYRRCDRSWSMTPGLSKQPT